MRNKNMIDEYMDKINFINSLLISSDIIKNILKKLSQIDLDKYILDIGSILYKNGKNIENYTLFPYDTYIKKGTTDKIYFKIAITYGIEENSLNYKSKFEIKCPVKIKKGVVLIGDGKYFHNDKYIELDEDNIKFMIWNTNLKLQTLKDKVQWEPYLYPHLDNTPNIVNRIYKNYNIYLETHDIDNHPENDRNGNKLKVTKEQHASIHLYMWEKYFLEDNLLKNNFTKNM
jgi:hypothetical protein